MIRTGSFSELSDSDMCEVNSPFSSRSSKEEEVVWTEPDRGRNRTCKDLPKRANTDFELGWKEYIQTVQSPAFSRVPGINKMSMYLKTAHPGICLKYSTAQKCSNLYRRKQTDMQRDHLDHQVEGHPRCLFPAHGDVLVDTPSSRGHIIK